MSVIERWTIHETRGPGLIRSGDFNAVVSGRALNEGEKVEVVPASHLAGAVEEAAGRIFASGILDEIAASELGEGRDAMDDAVTLARIAFGRQ